MKRTSLLAASLILSALMATSAFAQTGAQPGAGKIAWLDTVCTVALERRSRMVNCGMAAYQSVAPMPSVRLHV